MILERAGRYEISNDTVLVLTAEFQGQHRPVHHPEMGRGEEYRIERFEFADGTVWDAANEEGFETRNMG